MSPLINPHIGTLRVGRVMADIDERVFNYFFNPDGPCVFTGTRGARQALVAQFFDALARECVAQGIPSHWEPDNEARVQEIMNRMNFNTTTTK